MARNADLVEALRAVEQHSSKTAAAAALGIPRSTLNDRTRQAKRLGLMATSNVQEAEEKAEKTITENDRMRSEIRDMRAQLNQAKTELMDQGQLVDLIMGGVKYRPAPPDWAAKKPRKKGHSPGVPTLLWSDFHWGESVDHKQISKVNQFSLSIAKERFRKMIDITLDLTKHRLNDPWYPGIVVFGGGDMVSGSIHEELKETNECGMPTAVLSCLDSLVWGVERLRDEFGRVYMPWVVGNHGRLDRKPRAKGAVTESWDWLIGMLLARHFLDDQAVIIDVSSSLDIQWKIYGTTFNGFHGDQFRGGSGIQGALSPWMIGDYRKRKRARSIRQEYDYLVMGHWHQLTYLPGIIVNGSLKGYDEYAYRSNFPYEVAQQGCYMTHPEHGLTWWMPIKLQDPVDRGRGGEWISWQK